MTIFCTDVEMHCPRIRPAKHRDLLAMSSDARVKTVTTSPPSEGTAGAMQTELSCNGISPKSTLTLLAETDTRIVGVVHLTLQAEKVGLIHGLWIAGPHQESTLGLRIIGAMLEESKKLGVQKIDMDASTKTYAMIAMLVDCIQHACVSEISSEHILLEHPVGIEERAVERDALPANF